MPFSSTGPVDRLQPGSQFGPDPIVGPVRDVLVRRHLQVKAAQGRAPHAVQGEAPGVAGVDQLLRRRRHGGEDPEPAERVLLVEERQDASRDRIPADPVKPVTARDEIRLDDLALALMGEGHLRAGAVEPLRHHVGDLEQDLPAGRQPRRDQVLDHLLLAVDGDRAAGHQLLECDPVALPAEPQLDAVMDQALAQHPLAHTGVGKRVDGALFQHARPDPVLDVVAAAGLDHHGLDAAQVQQVGQQQPGRPRADDRDLGTH